jgi:hypothetical protein
MPRDLPAGKIKRLEWPLSAPAFMLRCCGSCYALPVRACRRLPAHDLTAVFPKEKSNLVTGPGVIPCASPKQAGKDLRLPGRDRQGPIRASEDLLGAE